MTYNSLSVVSRVFPKPRPSYRGLSAVSRVLLCSLGVVMLLGYSAPSTALEFRLSPQQDLIGHLQMTTVQTGQSLGDIGRLFDIGLYEMIEANPSLDPWLPTVGASVVVPSEFILPPGPRVGMVLNLAEMRLYYFDKARHSVITHPLSIGKKAWSTPMGQTLITHKKKNPPWYPPESVHQEHLANKDPLPSVVPGGSPENPLGLYALYLKRQGLAAQGDFLIHGTNRPAGVGVRVTHGCIRLFPEDIASLFERVPVGTPVRIIHEPYKFGWKNEHLYLEAHEPLSEAQYRHSADLKRLPQLIRKAIQESHLINWASAKMAAERPNGYPVRID